MISHQTEGFKRARCVGWTMDRGSFSNAVSFRPESELPNGNLWSEVV